MSDNVLDRPAPSWQAPAERRVIPAVMTPPLRPVLAMRVDGPPPPADALARAARVVSALEHDLLLVRALETLPDGTACTDPVEWERVRVRLLGELRRSADRLRCDDFAVDACVVDRFAPADFSPGTGSPPPAIGFLREPGELPWHRDADARSLVDSGASVLVVPIVSSGRTDAKLSRVLVPLDGSARAELAIERALRVAQRAHRNGGAASVVLVHVAPRPASTRIGPPDATTDTMIEELAARNRRVATDYLRDLARRNADAGISLEWRLLDGDPARGVLRAVGNDRIDLIVMASDGAGAHGDVAAGTVATHLAAHAPVPVLLIGSVDAARSRSSAVSFVAGSMDDRRIAEPPAGHG